MSSFTSILLSEAVYLKKNIYSYTHNPPPHIYMKGRKVPSNINTIIGIRNIIIKHGGSINIFWLISN